MATTGEVASAGSGASTLTVDVGPNGLSTSCSPAVSHSAESRLGTDLSQLGATPSTSAITCEPRTAAARLGCGDEISAVPSSHDAVKTRTS